MKIKPLVHGRYFHEHFGKIIAHQAEAYLEPIWTSPKNFFAKLVDMAFSR